LLAIEHTGRIRDGKEKIRERDALVVRRKGEREQTRAGVWKDLWKRLQCIYRMDERDVCNDKNRITLI